MSSLSHYSQGAATAERSRQRIQKNGCTPSGSSLWRAWEDDILREHYPNFPKIRELLPHRTSKAISYRGVRLGIARTSTHWSDTDYSILRRMFGSASKAELLKALPDHSWERIARKAEKKGLRRPRKPYVRTGDVANDSVRDRCFELNLTLVGLNEDCRTKQHFQKRKFGKYHPPYHAILKATKVLGGTIKLKWARDDRT
ncbi:hypothetical protein EV217_2860 [Phyllobacterium myrsinacearum]|nr:hypothetical protein EV217_2860 [Phyllobacterium myrsinacearum]